MMAASAPLTVEEMRGIRRGVLRRYFLAVGVCVAVMFAMSWLLGHMVWPGIIVVLAFPFFHSRGAHLGRLRGSFYFYEHKLERELFLARADNAALRMLVDWHGYEGSAFHLCWSDGGIWSLPVSAGLSRARVERLLQGMGLEHYTVEEKPLILREGWEREWAARSGKMPAVPALIA